MLSGVVIAIGAVLAGIAFTGIRITYFFQPTGALIVLGGTFGVALITTPRRAMVHAIERVVSMMWDAPHGNDALIEEIASFVRRARVGGILKIESAICTASNQFLREALQLALDVKGRDELKSALETKIRMHERQGESDAKALEVAGGFAPTIGVLGTVVGLIEVLKNFTDLSAIAAGTGTAFVSTIYGLALANLVLLPAAQRIRASVAETFETHELMMEGILCLFDGMHPSMVRDRLESYRRAKATAA